MTHPQPASLPTPRDIADRIRNGHDEILDELDTLPERREGVRPMPTPATVRVSRPQAGLFSVMPPFVVEGVTHWRTHDGTLTLYGPLDEFGRIGALESINPAQWVRVRRVSAVTA